VEAELSAPVESEVPPGTVVIDIRHPDEVELKPLSLGDIPVESIPFFRLNTQFQQLSTDARYLLYCEKGIMSQLHAAHLRDGGHLNVGVYRP